MAEDYVHNADDCSFAARRISTSAVGIRRTAGLAVMLGCAQCCVQPGLNVSMFGECRDCFAQLLRDVGIDVGEFGIVAVGSHGGHQFMDRVSAVEVDPT